MAIRYDNIELSNSGHDTYPSISGYSGVYMNIQSANGYVRIGSGNGTYAHFTTDRSQYYFDKQISFDGNIIGYGGDENTYFSTYYDSNDTSYYINPNGGSNVKANFTIQDNGSSSPLLDIQADDAGPWAIRLYRDDLGTGPQVYASDANTWYFNHTVFAGQSIRTNGDARAPIFYDSNNTNYYIDPNSSTSANVSGQIKQNNGKWVRDSHHKTIAGVADYYSSGGAGWTRIAEITLQGNCSGGVLYGTLYDHRYDGADAYQISIVARAECDFTSNNESHYVNIGCTILGSTNYVDYRNKIRVILIQSSTNLRKYELQFYETPWNKNTWQLETNGNWTIFDSALAPGSSTGTARVYYTSNQNADYVRANLSARAPIFYDSDDTTFYGNFADASNSIVVNGGVKFGSTNAESQGGFIGRHGALSTDLYPSPLYSIGDSYKPSGTGLSNHYGVGYAHTNASFYGLTGQSGWGFYVSADGDARVQLGGENGTISCTGDVIAYASDGRLKENIKPIENALDKINKINGVYYDWVENITEEYDFHPSKMHEVGVIAQEVQKVLPEVVDIAPFDMLYSQKTGWRKIQKKMEAEQNRSVSKKEAKEEYEKLTIKEQEALQDKNDFLTVKYEKLVPLLIEAIKELSEKVKILENK